jgi:DNA-binding NarL/FixJ family response regulator
MTDPFLLVLDAPSDTTKWVMIGLGAFVLLYLAVLRPMMRGKRDPLAAPPRGGGGAGGLSSQRAVERDMQNLLVEYEQMIRNMTAGLDTRAAKLELLIKEADEKLAALRAATAAGAAAPDGGGPPQRRDPAAAEPVPAGPDPRHLEIYNLSDQGLTARDVARKLGRPNGEVELILALRSGRE